MEVNNPTPPDSDKIMALGLKLLFDIIEAKNYVLTLLNSCGRPEWEAALNAPRMVG